METDDRKDVKEYEESLDTLKDKVKQLADKIRNAEHMVVFTGAGVSTSARIPDFRGPKGVWTLRQKGKLPNMEVTIEQALPTKCHMSLVQLQNHNFMKFLISQNVDGLHLRSGIKPELMSELHGNVYLEVCDDCGTEYLRNYSCTENNSDEVDVTGLSFKEIRHMTGRRCEKEECKGVLRDTIIDFGESLPKVDLRHAKHHSKLSDLVLVLGSSLTVSPACDLPKYAKECVIVNLQKTQHDSAASLRIFAKIDIVMELLMEELGLSIPDFHIDDMRPTLVHQPPEGSRRSRKPVAEVQLSPPLFEEADKINIDNLDVFNKSSCNIL